MNDHDRLNELAAGYVLAALEPEETQAFRLHVISCERCTKEVAELRAVLLALPETVARQEPPASLRERILAATRQGHQQEIPAPMRQGVPQRAARRQSPWAQMVRHSVERFAVAMVLVVALVGVFGTLSYRQIQTNRQAQVQLASSYEAMRIMAASDARWNFNGSQAQPQAAGVLAYSGQKHAASMVLWGMPQDTQTKYVVWTMTAGQKAPVGAMWPADGGFWILVPGDIRAVDGLGVSMLRTGATAQQVLYLDMAKTTPTEMGWDENPAP